MDVVELVVAYLDDGTMTPERNLPRRAVRVRARRETC
jgi:hypothetical protein